MLKLPCYTKPFLSLKIRWLHYSRLLIDVKPLSKDEINSAIGTLCNAKCSHFLWIFSRDCHFSSWFVRYFCRILHFCDAFKLQNSFLGHLICSLSFCSSSSLCSFYGFLGEWGGREESVELGGDFLMLERQGRSNIQMAENG